VSLNHVALTVSDRELSAAFYGRHFGLTERVHDDEHLLIVGSSDGSLLALTEGTVPEGLPRTNHFGFQLGDADEIRRARGRFREAGGDGDRVAGRPPVRPRAGRRSGRLPRRPVRDPRERSPESGPAPVPVALDLVRRRPRGRGTLLVHLSDEDGRGWTVLAVDRETREWAVAQARRQLEAVHAAYAQLYPQG
jgi:catechol 2,3-dioxygenase-like lactoylglutathione lyase family enzyme